MREQWQDDIWKDFFNDPLLSKIIEEAGMVDSDQDSNMDGSDENGEAPSEPGATPKEPEGSKVNLEQLTADFQAGSIEQEDLIKLYQSGKVSKEDIQQVIAQVEGEEPEDEEELMSQQIDQTNDTFVKFALYDKIQELTDKLDYFKENFDNTQSNIYQRVLQLREFLNILSSLIFQIETTVSYQMYGSILLQLTELFNEYNNVQKGEKAIEDKKDRRDEVVRKEKMQNDVDLELDEDNDEFTEKKSYQDSEKFNVGSGSF